MPVNAPNDNLDVLAPSFNLKNVDDQMVSLDNTKGLNGTVIVFICNHCPYVKSLIKKITYEAIELKKIEVNTLAIMSNDVNQYPEDSFDNMKLFSKNNNFSFHYLYDEEQIVAKKYNAQRTPDFFGFNNNLELQYRGRLDSSKNEINDNSSRDLYEAMKEISSTGEGPRDQIPSIGCSIKWKK